MYQVQARLGRARRTRLSCPQALLLRSMELLHRAAGRLYTSRLFAGAPTLIRQRRWSVVVDRPGGRAGRFA